MRGIVRAGVCLAVAASAGPILAEEFGRVPRREEKRARLTPSERSGYIPVIEVTAKPLRDVLAYIARYSGGYNIIPRTPEIGDKKISITLTNVYWRDVLDTIAELNTLRVDETRRAARILIVDEPPRVVLKAPDADVREVIMMIAEAAGANIVLSPRVQGKITVKLENIPWEEALDIIVKATNFVMIREPHKVIRIAAPEELKQQLETRVIRLKYVQPEGSKYVAKIEAKDYLEKRRAGGGQAARGTSLADVLQKVKSEAGQVAYDKRTNALVITDTPQKLEVIAQVIKDLDIPPKQVHLSVKLIELNDEDSENVGMYWQSGLTFSASGMAMDTTFPFTHGRVGNVTDSFWGDIGVVNVAQDRVHTLSSPDWQFQTGSQGSLSWGTLDFSQLMATLRFIKTQTHGKIVQAPQITALDHEEATIHVGRLVRYAEQFVETTEGGGRVSGFKEAMNSPVKLGIQILIIPHVTGPENNVLLTVIPKTESPAGAELFETFVGPDMELKLPQTSQRIVVTKMMMRDGETGVIAGLREEWEGTTITKVPFLGDIPFIGWLFSSRERPKETNKVSNLVIFITPKVIDFERTGDLETVMELSRTELAQAFAIYEAGSAPRP